MALASSSADGANGAMQLSCSLKHVKTCPSARILKVLLNRMGKSIQSTGSKSQNEDGYVHDTTHSVIETLKSIIEKYQYCATKLLDDLHHLQYEHRLNDDDAKFDEAFHFFKNCMPENGCNVNECPFVMRHYRVRGREDDVYHNGTDGVLLDTLAQIHCYLFHSFDINRLTKEERDRVNMELSVGIGLNPLDTDDNHSDNHSDDDNLSQSKRLKKINEILAAKSEVLRFIRDDRRYRDNVAERELSADQSIDFVMMAQKANIEEMVFKEGLSEYDNDRHRLISDLIDVVYAEDNMYTKSEIWHKLKVSDNEKASVFRSVLHGHFKSTQLNTDNLLKASKVFIARKGLQIDINALIDVVTTNGVDGRMFDKTVSDCYQNNGTFSKRFKGVANCKVQHVRQLYRALNKWKYVEPKEEVSVVVAHDEDEVDGKEDEKEPVDGGQSQNDGGSNEPDIYEIGKRFYFWNSHRKHPDYVAAKYKNMKEELLDNPLLDSLITIGAWNALTAAITALLATEKALGICSNGQSVFMYSIKTYEPLEAQHLRSLKLYTDFTDLSAKFCAILRWADPMLIAGIAHWTRYLIETVQCFGSTLRAQNARKTYYRGVDRAFIFKMVATRFNLPLSTTSDVK